MEVIKAIISLTAVLLISPALAQATEAHSALPHEPPSLNAILDQLYWPIINFTVTLLILRWIYKQFVAKNLVIHREQVAAEIAKSKSLMENAEQLLNSTSHRLRSIKMETTSIIREQTATGQRLAESLQAAAQKRAEQIANDTERQIAEELQRAEQEVRAKIIAEAVKDAEKMLRAQMNPELDKAFRDSALASLEG